MREINSNAKNDTFRWVPSVGVPSTPTNVTQADFEFPWF